MRTVRDIQLAKALFMLVVLMLSVISLIWIVHRAPDNRGNSLEISAAATLFDYLDVFTNEFPDEIESIIDMMHVITSNTLVTPYANRRDELITDIRSLKTEHDKLGQALTLDKAMVTTLFRENIEQQKRSSIRDNLISFILGVLSSLCATGLLSILSKRTKRSSQQGS